MFTARLHTFLESMHKTLKDPIAHAFGYLVSENIFDTILEFKHSLRVLSTYFELNKIPHPEIQNRQITTARWPMRIFVEIWASADNS